jgi:hypothetical protein
MMNPIGCESMWAGAAVVFRESFVMTDEHQDGQPTRARRRSAVKTAPRPSASKVKSTLHLSVEASQRLSVHATMLGVDRSELVEQLIRENLKRFVVSDRGGSSAGPDPAAGEE